MEHIIYATKEDIAEIKRVMDIGLATTKEEDWYATDDEAFIARHISEDGYILKYIVDDKLAGFLLVRYPGSAEDNLGRYLIDWTEEQLLKVVHMESAAVLPEYRGKKIQKQLLVAAEEIEQKRGARCLMATVHPENIYSLDNLKQLGYKCLLETEKYGGLRRKVLCKKLF